MTTPDRAAYRVEEAASLLGVSARTVRRLIASGRLRATDKPTLISRAALHAFLGDALANAGSDEVATQ